MRRRLDLRHLRIGTRRAARETHKVAGFLFEAVAGGDLGRVDSEACGEEGEDLKAGGMGGAHVGV